MPVIPGTDIDISFIQYDTDPKNLLEEVYVPNSNKNGLVGVQAAKLCLPNVLEKIDFLKRIFPSLKSDSFGFQASVENGVVKFVEGASVSLELSVKSTDPKLVGGSFTVSNVKLQVV